MRGPIVVTGATGQLGRALANLDRDHALRLVGRPECDFDLPETLDLLLSRYAPRAVINTAAYTNVDSAETNRLAAFRANRGGPARLARLCREASIPLIHLSTDYVFDGAKGAPYVESDVPKPLGVYGSSKCAGERAVLRSGSRAIILRTSWVISPTGRNFVRKMLSLGQSHRRLSVVSDQRGRPTSAIDLAAAVLKIVDRIRRGGWRERYKGVFHVAGGGEATWYELAVAVFEEAKRHGMAVPEVVPITSSDWPTPARRPADSRLDCSHFSEVFGLKLPGWRKSLRPVVEAIMLSGGP